MTILVNSSRQTVTVSYFDSGNVEQQTDMAPGEQFIVEGRVHPNTEALVRKRILTVSNKPALEQRQSSLTAGLPLVWSGSWRPGATYPTGNCVLYNGKTFVCITQNSGESPPADHDSRWELLSLKSFAAAFEFLVTVAHAGAVPWYDATTAEWKLSKLTDLNIDGITTAKITDMANVLATLVGKVGGTMTGPLTLSGNPTDTLHAAPKQYVDLMVPKSGGTMTGALSLFGNPTNDLHAVPKQYVVASFLGLAGGTMTGMLFLSGSPTDNLHAAPKQYVDTKLPLLGGTMTGALTLSGNPTLALHAAPKQYVDLRLALAGGTMTGALTLSGSPTDNLHAAPKQYVDLMVPLAGGTMTGALTLPGNPTLALHAAPKQYVDLRLALAGGTMTGPITGAHGLVQASGGTMTGALTLSGNPTLALHAAPKQYVDLRLALAGGTMTGQIVLHPAALTAGTGLYEASDHSVPAWKSGLLQVNYPPTIITGGHVALNTQGLFVFRGYQESVLNLGTNAPFATTLRMVVNEGQSNLFVTGQSETIVLSPGEAALLMPSGNDFIVVQRSSVPDVGGTMELASIGSETSGTRNVTFSLFDTTRDTTAVSAVDNPSVGVLRFTVASVTGIALGTKVLVSGTGLYDQEYLVHAISGLQISVQTGVAFSITKTGSMAVVRRTARSASLPMLALVSDTTQAWDGAAGAALSMVSGGSIQSQVPTGNGYRLETSGGTLVLNLDEQFADYRLLYVHLATVGRSQPARSSPVLDIVKLAVALTNSSDNGGMLQVQLASTAGFETGDSVTLAGTTNNGTYTVTSVASGPPRVRLNVAYFVIASGTMTNNNALTLSVSETAGLAAGSFVAMRNIPALGSERVTKEVVGVTDTTVIVKDNAESFNAALSRTGLMEQACIAKVEFLENSSSSSSSSSIQSSQSSASSVNSSSSSSSSSVNSSSSSSSTS